MHPLPRISDGAYKGAPCPTKPVSKIVTRRDTPQYLAQSLTRLEIFDDSKLTTPSQIKAALSRWRSCFQTVQAERIDAWLATQAERRAGELLAVLERSKGGGDHQSKHSVQTEPSAFEQAKKDAHISDTQAKPGSQHKCSGHTEPSTSEYQHVATAHVEPQPSEYQQAEPENPFLVYFINMVINDWE